MPLFSVPYALQYVSLMSENTRKKGGGGSSLESTVSLVSNHIDGVEFAKLDAARNTLQ
jgi:hypothetical protein